MLRGGRARAPGNARRGDPAGFTIVEVTVALVILSVAVLGIGVSAGGLARSAAEAEIRALALQAVEDRIGAVTLDPRYGALDSLYGGVETSLPGLDDFQRTTSVSLVEEQLSGGGTVEYLRITVEVEGPVLPAPVERTAVVGKP